MITKEYNAINLNDVIYIILEETNEYYRAKALNSKDDEFERLFAKRQIWSSGKITEYITERNLIKIEVK